MHNLSKFEEKLGVAFKNQDHLLQALTHRSYLNENPTFRLGHNERLEFLGDAVLELVVTEELYEKFPDKPEGDLTSFRAALVNAKILSDVALNLGVNDFLMLSRGEAKDTGRARQYILANAFEAIVGAIYLDQGYAGAKKFIDSCVMNLLEDVLNKKLYKDPKSLFQEEAQERVGITPNYEVTREAGPDHDKIFVVGVYLGKELVAEGEGPSKQIAQESAARNALEAKKWG
ncbi:MAG: ribonuclease III [Candidatus Sungbacteria bacterium]|nr:ribonuclease III [Candidatus Sungbacteria bacterium]